MQKTLTSAADMHTYVPSILLAYTWSGLQLRDSHRGVSRGNKNVGCGTWRRHFFCTCGSNNWETVKDIWVHAARGLASTELCFHSCNVLRDCHKGVPRANKKWRPAYVKMAIFCICGSNNWETVVDRRVHGGRRFASMALSFCPCKI